MLLQSLSAFANEISHNTNENKLGGSEVTVSTEFLNACTYGQVEVLSKILEESPLWVNGRSPQGETCLHVAGIQGQTGVTELIVKDKKGNPNIRTTFKEGLRMHPLSWNVYGGHIDTASVLLQYGADVNLDFDSMIDSKTKVTVLDIVNQIIINSGSTRDDNDQRFTRMKELLLRYGAKTYLEFTTAAEDKNGNSEL